MKREPYWSASAQSSGLLSPCQAVPVFSGVGAAIITLSIRSAPELPGPLPGHHLHGCMKSVPRSTIWGSRRRAVGLGTEAFEAVSYKYLTSSTLEPRQVGLALADCHGHAPSQRRHARSRPAPIGSLRTAPEVETSGSAHQAAVRGLGSHAGSLGCAALCWGGLWHQWSEARGRRW